MSAVADTKSQVREVLERLPDDCSLEVVQYHLYVGDNLRRRIAQADADQAVSHAEAKKRLEKWLIKKGGCRVRSTISRRPDSPGATHSRVAGGGSMASPRPGGPVLSAQAGGAGGVGGLGTRVGNATRP